jgi:hypothetical protein
MGNITSIGPLLERETIDGSKVFHKATPSLLTTYKEKIYAKEKDLKYRLASNWLQQNEKQ